MKHLVTKLISVLLVLSICFSMLPMEAFAWGKMTHIYTANQIEDELLNSNGSIAISYDGDDAVEYEIPDEYYEAIMAYPDAFRAGALGPDVYPDILTGQMFIHPAHSDIDSGEWITYLCNAVNKMGKGTEGRKICLSFTLGCILHYCGDLFGHDFVNTFAGGSFPSLLSTEILNIKGERLNNVLSHLSLESYMDEIIYPNYNKDADGDIDAPNRFVTNTLIFDGTLGAGLNPLYEKYPPTPTELLDKIKAKLEDIWLVGSTVETIIKDFFDEDGNNVPPHYTAMLALRTYVTSTADEYRENMEPVSAAITAFYDEWAEDIDKGIVEFTATCDRIANRIVTGEKNPEIEAKTKEERLEEQNKILAYFGYGDIAAVNMRSMIKDYYPKADDKEVERIRAELNDAGLYGDSFFDIVLAELVLQGSITTDMLKTENSSILIIKEELSHWLDEYGVYMLCLPDVIIDGIEIPIVGDLLDIISAILDLLILEPLWELIAGEIKNLISGWFIADCTGLLSDVTGWDEKDVPDNLKEIVAKITERLEHPDVQLDHEDNPFRPSENNFAELKEYMDILASEVKNQETDSDFEALYNTITMFKLVLMGPENYSKFIQTYAGVNQTAYQTNTASPEVTSLKVRIKTSDLYLSGTDDNIYLIVYELGEGGKKDFARAQIACKLLDLSATNDFEADGTAIYTVELPRSVKLERMEIALRKTPAFDFLPGVTDDWRCENIRITPMFAGYELTAPIDLGGVFLQGICDSVGMNFQTALQAKNPADPKSQIVTNLQVRIKVRDKQYAGTDSDIYLKVYNNGALWQSVLLDKAMYNDLEQGDNDMYNIPIVLPGTTSQGIPLNQLSIEIVHAGIDEANWEDVQITPCYGSIRLTDAISVGGKTFENTTWKPNFQKKLKNATYRQEPNLSQTATSLKIQIDVANEFGAGTNDDIFLHIYSLDGTTLLQYTQLNIAGYDDFEMGDSYIYTVELTKKAANTPMDQLRLFIEKRGYSDKPWFGQTDLIEYTDDAKWDEVLITPYNGSKALTDPISLGGTDFEDPFWDTNFRTQLKLHYLPLVMKYETSLDDGLLYFMDSLDGGEEWVDADNELWENTALRTDVFFKIFKGFAPEIEYAGSESIMKGKPAEIKLNFTGMWNGVSNDRRSQVKDFAHVYAVAGTVDIEFINDNGKSVLKTTGVKVADDQVSITIPYNDSLAPGYEYDIKVTYHPDKANPVYAGTEVVFENALRVTVPNSCYVNISASPDDGGSVTGGGFYKYEESCTVSAQPNAGYEFVEWRNDAGAVSKNTSYTFTVTEGCNLVAVFKEISSDFTSAINDGKTTAEISMGEVYSLYVKCEGGTAPYTYEWQYLEPGKTVWKRGTAGNGISTIGMVGNDTVNGRRYRVEITDANGKKSISNEIAIIVEGGKFAVQINDGAQEIVFEDNVNEKTKILEANIMGGIGSYTYKWYINRNGVWEKVSESSTYKLPPNADYDKAKIKVEVTDSTGKKTTSEEVTIKFNRIFVN